MPGHHHYKCAAMLFKVCGDPDGHDLIHHRVPQLCELYKKKFDNEHRRIEIVYQANSLTGW